MKTDYVSTGPWVEKVEARIGVDTSGNGEPDFRTGRQAIRECYGYIEGFSKQIRCDPATLDLEDLPAGFGFCFDLRTEVIGENGTKPILYAVRLSFRDAE